MASLSLKHIYKVYGGNVKAVNDFSMDIRDKEFIVFVGPSGCGKSTTLRMIAGLEEITAGELRIDDEIVNDYEPKDRNIAMVFQNYALYPHMSVYENMAFSLRILHMSEQEIHDKVLEAAEILGITEYLERKPKALSGGQRQRVALGRAIVRNPKVFLLDEPLSNLDAKLRAAMRAEITRLHNRLQTTFIYVTHDQVEAMTMGTRIVVMKGGYIQQVDTPQNLYRYPVNQFVAGFIGTPQMNFFDGVIRRAGAQVRFDFACGTGVDMERKQTAKIPVRYMDGTTPVVFGIRPDDIRLWDPSLGEDWQRARAVVGVVEALGGETLLYANFNTADENDRSGAVTVKAPGDCEIARGDTIEVAIHKPKIHVFDKATEMSIMMRIPPENMGYGTVQDGKLLFAGQSLTLPPYMAGKLHNGACEVTFPPEAVLPGTGDWQAAVDAVEHIDGKCLYHLSNGDVTFFALTEGEEAKWEVGTTVPVSLNLTQVGITGEAGEVIPLDTTSTLTGTYLKQKERDEAGKPIFRFYLEIGKQLLASPDPVSQRLFACKGTKIFRTPLSYRFDANCVRVDTKADENRQQLIGQVDEIRDYGQARYAFVRVDGTDGERVCVPMTSDLTIGQPVVLTPDLASVTVIDRALDIIIL